MYDFNDQICKYVPTWFRDILEYQALCQSETEQFTALQNAIQAIANNFFFQTMDAQSVAQWEKVFSIIPNPQTETLDFRRARIINRISTRPPFTLGFLYQKLDQIIGPGQWQVEVDYPNYTLYIEASAADKNYWSELAVTLNTIKPAHIVYTSRPLLSTPIQMSETVHLSRLIYNYRLGSWGLGVLPFASEQDQGVIVTPTQRSIQQELLNQTASFVASDVASARLNGTIPITSLSKTTDANIATITYTVLESQANPITQVELLDASGNVLETAGVYVPVTGSAVFKHTIPVTLGGTA